MAWNHTHQVYFLSMKSHMPSSFPWPKITHPSSLPWPEITHPSSLPWPEITHTQVHSHGLKSHTPKFTPMAWYHTRYVHSLGLKITPAKFIPLAWKSHTQVHYLGLKSHTQVYSLGLKSHTQAHLHLKISHTLATAQCFGYSGNNMRWTLYPLTSSQESVTNDYKLHDF